MAPTIRIQPTAINLPDREGCLVFANDALVAVLIHLSDMHGEDAGKWTIEASFGLFLHLSEAPLFTTLDEATDWLGMRAAA